MSNDKYINLLKIKNPNIIPLEEYKNMKTPILHKCLIHDIKWSPYPESVLKGCGCPKCSSERISFKLKKTHEEYIEEIKHRNILVIEKYIDALTPILHKCTIDGYEWKAAPNSILQGCGCPKCSNNIKKTTSEYRKEVEKINPNIEVVDDYITARTPIKHRCKIDGFVWSTFPYSVLQGCGCPKCNSSKGERKIDLFLNNLGISYIFQKTFEDCRDTYTLPFDFYLPSYNACIEYDGIQHFKPIQFFGGEESLEKQKRHDEIKNNYCKENGIDLLRIPYYEYNNIENNISNFLFI